MTGREIERVPGELPLVSGNEGIASRLLEMKAQRILLDQFVREVMVEGEDYGVIPGTQGKSLLKSGAEKLCALYGYTIRVAAIDEDSDRASGYYRARVTVALDLRADGGVVIAEGVGEANTYEGRYRWRWEPEWKVPEALRHGLQFEERRRRDGGTFLAYRVENGDPWALWNTVLKMAKKRALVDATLSATRLTSFADGEHAGESEGAPPSQGNARRDTGDRPADQRAPRGSDPTSQFWAVAIELGLEKRVVLRELNGRNPGSLTAGERAHVLAMATPAGQRGASDVAKSDPPTPTPSIDQLFERDPEAAVRAAITDEPEELPFE